MYILFFQLDFSSWGLYFRYVNKTDFMKKEIFYITVCLLLGVSCKKQTPVPLSQWAFDGIVYKGYAKTYIGSFGASTSTNHENGNNYVSIQFYNYNADPSTSGVFKVKRSVTNSSECLVKVGVTGNSLLEYQSVDSDSEVIITVSPSGKLSASFTGIVLKINFGTETKTVSGTLVEQ